MVDYSISLLKTFSICDDPGNYKKILLQSVLQTD